MNTKVNTRIIYDRKKIGNNETLAPISIEVMHKRVRRYFSTGIKVYPYQFDKSRLLICRREDAPVLNERLSIQLNCIETAINVILSRDGFFNFELLEHELSRSQKVEFLEFYDNVQRPRSMEATKNSVYNHLYAYGKIKGFDDLTLQNIEDFNRYLLRLGKNKSTINSYLKTLKYAITEARKQGYIKTDPMEFFKYNKEETTKIKYLTKEQLKIIEYAQIDDKSLSICRDIFLLQCYTGVSWIDLDKIKTDNFARGEAGYLEASFNRRKTSGLFIIVLLPKAEKILNKYNGALPKVSYMQQITKLKELSSLLGLDINLTTHIARHTFATTLTLGEGVPIEILSKMLGHSNINTTQRYAKVMGQNIKNEFYRLAQKDE